MTGLPASGVSTWNDASWQEARPVREPLRFPGGAVGTHPEVVTEAVGPSSFIGNGLVGRPE